MTLYRPHRSGWGSTLSLNAMPTGDSYGMMPEQTYGVPFRRSKSVRNLSMYDGDDLDSYAGRRHVRRIVLRRSSDLGVGLGFSIRGGRELGIGIFVSKVMERSVADRAGLMPGDEILSVNDTSFENISHEEAIKILKAAPRLDLVVCSPARIPGACIVHQTYTWLDSEGRSVSPPPEYDHSFYSSPAHRKAVSRLHHSPRIRKVTLRIDKGQSLGLMIRGGVEYGLGVYITGVDKLSVADMASLKVGDQILEVNNQSFLDITHDEAVRVLKYSPLMVMTIREVGKVPYSCTTYDENSWLYDRQNSGLPARSSRLQRKGCLNSGLHPYENLVHTIDIQALRILNEKAKLVLTKAELATLNYYRIEYERRQMTIDSFVAVLLEMFETEEKYALLQDIREVIHPADLHKFDEMIYKKDLEMARTRQRLGPDDRSSHNRFSSISMDHLTSHVASTSSPRNNRRDLPRYANLDHNSSILQQPYDVPRSVHPTRHHGLSSAFSSSLPGGYMSDEDLHTPSEDSGVDSTNGSYYVANRSTPKVLKHAVPLPLQSPLTRNGIGGGMPDSWQSRSRDPVHHGYERRRRSIEDVQGLTRYQAGENDYQHENAVSHQRRSADRRWSIGSEQTDLDMSGNYKSDEGPRVTFQLETKPKDTSKKSSRKKSNYWYDKNGNMTVMIEKSKPTLGVVIEGGSDTRHSLPRVVNIQPNGAAFEAGGLRVGHIILSVGKLGLQGLDHQSAANLISTAYADPRHKRLKLVVTEEKKSARELRQKSLSFLYGE